MKKSILSIGMVIIAMATYSQVEINSETNVDSIVLEKPLNKLKVTELKVQMEDDCKKVTCCYYIYIPQRFNDPFGQSLSFTQKEIERMTRTLR
ncbi:MAG: hypothetical protein NWR83_08100 [Salibacteraceae bacterium]|nr:hypothetical protein [Salibacteraceae bacterium]